MTIILNIPDVINIDNLTASYMSIGNYSKEQAITAIKRLKGKELNIILEPYPWTASKCKLSQCIKTNVYNSILISKKEIKYPLSYTPRH